MVSFRRDQFQALLVAVVIADATSHGFLPRTGATVKNTVYQGAGQSTLISDRGCHLLADTLNCLVDQAKGETVGPSTTAVIDAMRGQLSSLSGVEAIIAGLPWMLPWVDAAGFDHRAADAAELIEFYPLIRMALNQQSLLGPIAGATGTVPTDAGEKLNISLVTEIVLGAHGDFELTLGQSLYHPAAFPGITLLSSLLSAAWWGLQTIPAEYYQVLGSPAPPLRTWLEKRWHIATLKVAENWAEALWQQWLGRYRWSLPDLHWGAPSVQPFCC